MTLHEYFDKVGMDGVIQTVTSTGRQLTTPEQANGIALLTMLTQVRIAEALERIAVALEKDAPVVDFGGPLG